MPVGMCPSQKPVTAIQQLEIKLHSGTYSDNHRTLLDK